MPHGSGETLKYDYANNALTIRVTESQRTVLSVSCTIAALLTSPASVTQSGSPKEQPI
jgi:hypothetical protein